MTDKVIEAAARALVRQYEIEDGFSEEQAEQHSKGEMWKNFRKAAECAIAAYEQAMWRPIEEAPKDGGRFLVATTQQLVHEAYYLDNSLSPWPWKGIKPASCKILMNLFKPTHYRPLPPPPGKEG